jgi:CHAT domain-containing protein
MADDEDHGTDIVLAKQIAEGVPPPKKADETPFFGLGRPILRVVLALSVLASAACEPSSRPAVSLEEAKNIAADLPEGASFAPPPRTVEDILALLDSPRPEAVPAIAEARKIADSVPPQTKDANALAEFYVGRAAAAHRLGRAAQEISDLTAAEEHAGPSYAGDRVEILSELSSAQALAGDYSHSIRTLEAAVGQAQTSDRRGWLINLYSRLAQARALAGDFDAADEFLSKATALHAESISWKDPLPRHRASYEANVNRALAMILDSKGQYRKGELHWRTMVDILGRSPWWRDKSVYDLSLYFLSQNLKFQGRLVEAEVEARRALLGTVRKSVVIDVYTAHTLRNLTSILLARGRFEEAEMLARRDLEIYRSIGALPGSVQVGLARINLGSALALQERWADALGEFEGARADMAADPNSFRSILEGNPNYVSPDYLFALLRTGRSEEAMAIAGPLFERSSRVLGPTHPRTALYQALYAMSLAAVGQTSQALANFADAVPILSGRYRRVAGDDGGVSASKRRLSMILDAYIRLLLVGEKSSRYDQSASDAVDRAFTVADIAREHGVQQALAQSGARAAARDPDLADLARRAQDAETQIAALNEALTHAVWDGSATTPADRLEASVEKFRAAHAVLMSEIERRFPEYAELTLSRPMTVGETHAALRPGETLLAFYVGEDRSYIWAVPQTGRTRFASADIGRKALAERVALLRAALDPRAATLGDIPAFDVRSAFELYTMLLEPVKEAWKNSRNLLVVPHGALDHLPLSVLPTEPMMLAAERKPLFSNHRDVPWLARNHAITVLPSAASLRTLRGLPSKGAAPKPLVAFADPVFSLEQATARAAQREPQLASADDLGSVRGLGVSFRSTPATAGLNSAQLSILPPLPETADEARAIAAALNAGPGAVLTGADANEQRVKSMDLTEFKVVAFATHGLIPGDLDGLVEPALALSSPVVSGTSGDGLLTMGEILGLRLNAEWVVLSACNTAAGQGAGAEAISGLGRAFFYAGSRALLVSNWPVHSAAAMALTATLFRRQAEDPTLSKAEALRQAMTSLIDDGSFVDSQGRIVFSYAHPLFWAPFTVVGEGDSNAI